jgi:hypothetical protein
VFFCIIAAKTSALALNRVDGGSITLCSAYALG